MSDPSADDSTMDRATNGDGDAEAKSEKAKLKENLKTGSTWLRGFYMVLFVIFYGIAEFVLFAAVIFQFLTVLVTREANQRLVDFGRSVSRYIYEIMLYLTYNIDERPFPFGDWPGEKNITPAPPSDADATV